MYGVSEHAEQEGLRLIDRNSVVDDVDRGWSKMRDLELDLHLLFSFFLRGTPFYYYYYLLLTALLTVRQQLC